MPDELRERFAARTAGDLARFAQLVCPDRAAAAELVEQAVRRAVEDQPDPDASTRWPEATRVWIVRAALSQDRRLEAGVAADVDVPRPASPGADVGSAFAGSSPLQRCVTVLHWFEHLDASAIAAVVGSTAEGIAAYLGTVRGRLGLQTDPAASEQQLRRLLRTLYEDADPAAPELVAAVRRALDLPAEPELDPQRSSDAQAADAARRVAELAAAQAIRRRDEAERRRAEAEAATAVAVAAAEQAAAQAARAAAEAKAQQAAADREICERAAAERAAAEAEERRRKAEAAAITAETALSATVSTLERTERTLLELNSAVERQRRATAAHQQAADAAHS